MLKRCLGVLTDAATGSVLRNFAKLTGKDLSGKASAGNFIKKEALVLVFSCDFHEISKNTFFTEHLCENVSALITYHGRQASEESFSKLVSPKNYQADNEDLNSKTRNWQTTAKLLLSTGTYN